jgi:UTP--glucose-1-phosphate uridylyltransferase
MKGLDMRFSGETLIEPFAVILADDLYDGNSEEAFFSKWLVFNKYKCSIVAIEEIDPSHTNRYSIIEGKEIEGVYMISIWSGDPSVCATLPLSDAISSPDIFGIIENTLPVKG